jgi:hypothetical protein
VSSPALRSIYMILVLWPMPASVALVGPSLESPRIPYLSVVTAAITRTPDAIPYFAGTDNSSSFAPFLAT